MPNANFNGIDCYYEIHGNGRSLVLIAGLASDSQSWQLVIGALKKHFKVVVFDNRGIGRTKYPAQNFRISTLALDTVNLMDNLGMEKADILGHSMGGCIAQEIAIEYPQRVNKLVLANTCAALSPENKSLLANLLRILESGDYELFIREFFSLIFTPEYLSNKDLIEPLVKAALNYPFPVTPEDFRLQLEALINFNSQDSLGKIRSGTLLMAGRKDILVTSEETQLLADRIPGVEIRYLENTAHSFMEKPELFSACALEFLR